MTTSVSFEPQAKSPSKMSFYSEEAAATIARIPNATPKQHAAARRLLAKRPDCEPLTAIIFGDKP